MTDFSLPSSYTPFSFYNRSYDSISDWVDPPSGTRARFNPVSHTKHNYAPISGEFEFQFNDPNLPPLRCRCCVFGGLTASHRSVGSHDWSSLIAKMATALKGNLNTGTLLGVTLMETAKTISMFKNPFKILSPHYLRQRGKLTKQFLSPAKRLRNKAADVWLEAQYGWNSFYQDVKNFASSSASILNPANFEVLEGQWSRWAFSNKLQDQSVGNWIYQYGENDATWQSSQAQYFPWATNGGYRRARITSTVSTATIGCMQVLHRANAISNFVRNQHLLGLTPSEIVATLWEVIPFSFVVDWFINWHYLSRYFNEQRLFGSDVRKLGCSLKVLTNYDFQFVPIMSFSGNNFPGIWYGKPPKTPYPLRYCEGKGSFSSYTRDTGLPNFTNVQSGFASAGLSLKQGTSAAALIVQLLKNPH